MLANRSCGRICIGDIRVRRRLMCLKVSTYSVVMVFVFTRVSDFGRIESALTQHGGYG
jgi:hypothetical protein